MSIYYLFNPLKEKAREREREGEGGEKHDEEVVLLLAKLIKPILGTYTLAVDK